MRKYVRSAINQLLLAKKNISFSKISKGITEMQIIRIDNIVYESKKVGIMKNILINFKCYGD